jgi:hypothetical protein
MRTTLTLDDRIAKALKTLAHRSGKPFKQIVNETLQSGLTVREKPTPRPYRLKPASLGGVLPGINLDRALRLAAALEDEEISRELALRRSA